MRILELALKAQGHHGVAVLDGIRALELSARELFWPDVVRVDDNLPNGMNWIEVIAKLRGQLGVRDISVVMLLYGCDIFDSGTLGCYLASGLCSDQ